MASLTDRMLGAARLDPATYEEVEADSGATGQAAVVVLLSALAAGVGALREAGLPGLVGMTLTSLLSWYAWAAVAYLVGVRFLPGSRTDADLGQLLRTTGFSAAPGCLQVLGLVPGIGRLVVAVTGFWMLASMVVAVRQALDYDSTGRAVAVCAIGFVIYFAAMMLLAGAVYGVMGAPA
jgi:hypothetical protein